ncbi:hypothetical protein [Telluribacter sp.]|jgi:hypothetical protein|uniref:hypothetical protein n=1 Tax=Telluribacter sp. TaxID=1978767 RepID=UPI002E0EA04E|nr:hypothetical protein [Telluribacter sp.]
MIRRNFLKNSLLGGLGMATLPSMHFFPAEEFPVERITDGAHPHWFGYYDKLQVDPTGRYALGMQAPFEGHTPGPDDPLEIGLIDLQDNNKWRKLGTSNAWGWQQGCMLQWLPNSKEEVIWNDRIDGAFKSRVRNIRTGKERILPKAIYALAPNGKFAVGTEFNRIQNLRPGYGYVGITDPYEKEKAPADIGIYRMDLKTGKHKMLVSYAEMAAVPHLGESVDNYWHWFNHLLIGPDSKRMLFLNRWRHKVQEQDGVKTTPFITRMVTMNTTDGGDRYVIDPSGDTSHIIWDGPGRILAWTRPVGKEWGFWLMEDHTQNSEHIGAEAMTVNGHNTYIPGTDNEWVLNDTYPDGDRMQTLYLYHVPSKRRVILGKFLSPPQYKGEYRCDLHPRANQQGTEVFFDSTHEKLGRQIYRISIEKIIRV